MVNLKFEKFKSKTAFAVVIVVLVIGLSGITLGHMSQSDALQTVPLLTGVSFSVNDIHNNMSVNVSRVAYIDQPTQAMYSPTNPQVQPYVVGNVSIDPYLMFYNATVGTTPFVSHDVFNLANYISAKGNVQYMFLSERIAYNGSGLNNYMVLSGTNLSAAPSSATGNLAYFEYGSSGASFTFTNGTNSTGAVVSSSYTLPSGTMSALQFYTAEIQVTPTAIELNLSQNGVSVFTKIVNAKTNLSTYVGDLNNATASSLYVENFMSPTASTTGDASMMNYMYFLDKNTYQASALITPAIAGRDLVSNVAGVQTNIVNFDPATAQTNLSANPTLNYTAPITSKGIGSFASVNESNSTESILASDLNTSIDVTNASLNATHTFLEHGIQVTVNKTINANDTVGALRQHNDSVVSSTTTESIGEWNTSQVSNGLQSQLASYLSSKTGIPVDQIQIISYLIDSVSIDSNVTPSVVNSIDNTLYNTIPALLQQNNLSLVNMSTGAIVAGNDAGQFYNPSAAVSVVADYQNGMIVNPFTNVAYSSPSQAGFGKGATLTSYTTITGQLAYRVYVSQLSIVGWFEGQPLFAKNPALTELFGFGGLFGGLTSSGSAVANFFHSAGSSIVNQVKSGASTVSKTVSTPLRTVYTGLSGDFPPVQHAVSNYVNQASNTVHNLIPDVGGVATNVVSSIKSLSGSAEKTLATGVGKVGTSLGSVASESGGALLTGAHNIGTTAYNLGGSAKTTLGNAVTESKAVIDPYFVSAQSLPGKIGAGIKSVGTSVASIVHGAGNKSMSVLNYVGTGFKDVGGTIYSHVTAFGNMTKNFISDFGTIGGKISSFMGWIWNIAMAFGHYVIYAVAIIGGIIVLVIGFIIYRKVHGFKKISKKFGGGSFKRKIRTKSVATIFDVANINNEVGFTPNTIFNFKGEFS